MVSWSAGAFLVSWAMRVGDLTVADAGLWDPTIFEGCTWNCSCRSPPSLPAPRARLIAQPLKHLLEHVREEIVSTGKYHALPRRGVRLVLVAPNKVDRTSAEHCCGGFALKPLARLYI